MKKARKANAGEPFSVRVREQAEQLAAQAPPLPLSLSNEEMLRQLHELQVSQIELQMQNAALAELEQLRSDHHAELVELRREAAEERAALRREASEQLSAILARFDTPTPAGDTDTTATAPAPSRRGRRQATTE